MAGAWHAPLSTNRGLFYQHLEGAVERVRGHLLAVPEQDPLATAQVCLLPLLLAAGLDVFDLRVLWPEALAGSRSLRYQLALGDARISIEVHALGSRPGPRPGLPEGSTWGIWTNARDWHLLEPDGTVLARSGFHLFEAGFARIWGELFTAHSDIPPGERSARVRLLLEEEWLQRRLGQLVARTGRDVVRLAYERDPGELARLLAEAGLVAPEDARGLDPGLLARAAESNLNATEHGHVRSAPPLSAICLADVLRHAESIRNLRGGLEAQFDGEPVPVFSRSAFYLVLAALALQYGRDDLIPAGDLVQPHQPAPTDRRTRPLGRPGWHLILDHDQSSLGTIVDTLLGHLNLRQRFTALHAGAPFP